MALPGLTLGVRAALYRAWLTTGPTVFSTPESRTDTSTGTLTRPEEEAGTMWAIRVIGRLNVWLMTGPTSTRARVTHNPTCAGTQIRSVAPPGRTWEVSERSETS